MSDHSIQNDAHQLARAMGVKFEHISKKLTSSICSEEYDLTDLTESFVQFDEMTGANGVTHVFSFFKDGAIKKHCKGKANSGVVTYRFATTCKPSNLPFNLYLGNFFITYDPDDVFLSSFNPADDDFPRWVNAVFNKDSEIKSSTGLSNKFLQHCYREGVFPFVEGVTPDCYLNEAFDGRYHYDSDIRYAQIEFLGDIEFWVREGDDLVNRIQGVRDFYSMISSIYSKSWSNKESPYIGSLRLKHTCMLVDHFQSPVFFDFDIKRGIRTQLLYVAESVGAEAFVDAVTDRSYKGVFGISPKRIGEALKKMSATRLESNAYFLPKEKKPSHRAVSVFDGDGNIIIAFSIQNILAIEEGSITRWMKMLGIEIKENKLHIDNYLDLVTQKSLLRSEPIDVPILKYPKYQGSDGPTSPEKTISLSSMSEFVKPPLIVPGYPFCGDCDHEGNVNVYDGFYLNEHKKFLSSASLAKITFCNAVFEGMNSTVKSMVGFVMNEAIGKMGVEVSEALSLPLRNNNGVLEVETAGFAIGVQIMKKLVYLTGEELTLEFYSRGDWKTRSFSGASVIHLTLDNVMDDERIKDKVFRYTDRWSDLYKRWEKMVNNHKSTK
tara:strand:- start:510 stop:2330 length:1821 start_codon:yes stop_codon:yes gene_type:complete